MWVSWDHLILVTDKCGEARPSEQRVGSWISVCKWHPAAEGGKHPIRDFGGIQRTCVMCKRITVVLAGFKPAEKLCGFKDSIT